MKVVFFGTSTFAVPILESIRSHVCLVISQPDRPSGRGLKMTASPVKELALKHGIEVKTPERSRNSEFIAEVQSLHADSIIVAAYGQILPKNLLDSAKYGSFNLHGSVLPRYRGAAPIQRALEHGDLETGVTLMQMDAGMDTGDIIDIQKTVIDRDETSGDLLSRLANLAAQMTSEWLPRLCSGDYPRNPQDNNLATYAKKIEKSETELYTGSDAQVQYNKFRAFTPVPGAWLKSKWGVIKIKEARLNCEFKIQPGELQIHGGKLFLGFENGSLELLMIQPEGKKAVSGADFANGIRIQSGEKLVIPGTDL